MTSIETDNNYPDLGECSILIVDDEPANLMLMFDTLSSYGIQTMIARTGTKGFELAKRNLPDLIVLDINLPDIDGYEVCKRLKDDPITCDIPVIFLSVLKGAQKRIKGFESGAVDYIAKPFQQKEVLARITTHLRLRMLAERLEQTVQRRTSELEEINKQLTQSEQRYAMAQRAGNIGSWDLDVSTDQLTWSDTIEPMFGFAPGQFGGSYDAFLECVHSEDRQFVIDEVNAAIKHNQPYSIEHRIVWPDETVHWVSATGEVFRNEQGEAIRMFGVVQDITKRKQAEQELIQHREHLEELVRERTIELQGAKDQAIAGQLAAEEANRAKSDFLARMSHEIRTPLNAVTGLTNILLRSELKNQQRDYLNKIQIASDNLLNVINDILDFSKVEASQLELASDPFDLDAVLENLAGIFRSSTSLKDLELIFSIAADVPRNFIGDAARLTQVLTNLINNAVKFTEKGEIVIAVQQEDHIPQSEELTTLTFSVSDTGIGIETDVLPTLFDPFTQVEGYLTRSHEGTGLGLAICQRLVTLMGGKMHVQSIPGKGSTFSFSVKLKTGKIEKRALSLSEDLRGLKTLVVDDNPVALQVLYDMLASFQFDVVAVNSGDRALSELHQATITKPYQLVVMDWKMPGLDGIETAHRIRNLEQDHPQTENQNIGETKQSSPCHIIILVTAYGLELLKSNINTAAVDSIVEKPVKPSLLFNTIIKLLGKKETGTTRFDQTTVNKPIPQLVDRRVLVVEDSALNRDVAVTLLEEAGLKVETAENGQIAMARLTDVLDNYYDAILMDIQMPVMDGYNTTRQIRMASSGISKIPVIAVTAHALKGEKEKCLAAGMDDYLAKPIDEDKLLQILHKWIDLDHS